MNIYNCFSEKYSVYKGNFNSKLFQNLSKILDYSISVNGSSSKISILLFDLDDKMDSIGIDAFLLSNAIGNKNNDISCISFDFSLSLEGDIKNIMNYYLPYVNNLDKIVIPSNISEKVLELIGGNHIRKGVIVSILGKFYIIEYKIFKGESPSTFFNNIYNIVNNIHHYISANIPERYYIWIDDDEIKCHAPYDISYSPIGREKELFYKRILEELDSDTKIKINEIKSCLKKLKDSGQLFLALPILEQMVNDYYKEIDVKDLSPIHIDEEYKILLPKFGNIEVPLNHLTRAIYILFYNHPEGIDLKDLKQHKQELLNLYLNISNQHNYDKMMATIDNLLNDEKAIYPHLSRIKSVFCSIMTVSYAEHYFIIGDREGSSFKYIPMLKTSSKHHLEEDPFEDELSELFKSFKYDFNEEIDDEDLNF